MGHKGPLLRPRCIGPGRARTHILFCSLHCARLESAIQILLFDVHMTMHRVKFRIIKPTRCTNFSNFILGPSSSCLQAVSKPVWLIPLMCVQWKTPYNGQRNCPKHVEFHSKNKIWEISAYSLFYYKKPNITVNIIDFSAYFLFHFISMGILVLLMYSFVL
jgi:hypothetical protein